MKFGEHSGELKKRQGKPNENFVREKGAKDRFGNQYLTSKEFSYGSNGQETSAGILISPEGQKFIAEHPKILHDIDKNLACLESGSEMDATHGIFFDHNQSCFLQKKAKGSQSNFYVLALGQEKYAIKTHVTHNLIRKKIDQPYVNEMLQTQSISQDLKSELEDLNIRMSSFIFASGQVSCTKYEEKSGDYSKITSFRLTKFFNLLSSYIKKKQKERDPLWQNIIVDSNGNLETILRNFIVERDEEMVCVDPFIYEE